VGQTSIGLLLACAILAGCGRVARIPPSELPALSRHGPGAPPVRVSTIDRDPFEIEDDFKYVRFVGKDPETAKDRDYVLRPPFKVARFEHLLLYQRRGEPPQSTALEHVREVEVVQHDGARIATILTVATAAVVAGFLGGAYLQAEADRDAGDSVCGLCGPVFGAMLLGGISLAITIPTTKYY
jgi:hypothetical protein